MIRLTACCLGLVTLGFSAVACSSSSSTGGSGGTSGGVPSIKITSPTTGATISAATDSTFPDLSVPFTVQNFTLMAPGTSKTTCPLGACGHVHLYVNAPGADKNQCNDVPDKFPYNSADFASPLTAGLDYCPTIPGARVITVELHNTDHSAVNDANGKQIADSVSITVVGGASDAGADAAP